MSQSLLRGCPLLVGVLLLTLSGDRTSSAEEPAGVQPVRVCTVLQDFAAYEGKVVAVVGRYSFRREGRFLSEENCGNSGNLIPVAFDQKLAPKTPEHLEIPAGVVTKLLKQVQQTTALAKFRFGTPDYDRWAVVYGRIEQGKSSRALMINTGAHENTTDGTHAELVCAGDSVVMFIVDRY